MGCARAFALSLRFAGRAADLQTRSLLDLRPRNSRAVAEPVGRLFLCSGGFTTSRAQSRKSCATGLIVRFFNVIMPTGQGEIGSSTGKTLNGGRFVPNFSTESGSVTKKGPFGRRYSNKWGEPVAAPRNEIPRARKASRTRGPAGVSDDGRPQGSFASSDRSTLRRVHQRLCNPATTKR